MREINRSHYLRGTKAWKARNLFVFGGIALTVALGFASVMLFPGQVEQVRQRTEEEQKQREARREKLATIRQRRMEMMAAMEEAKKE